MTTIKERIDAAKERRVKALAVLEESAEERAQRHELARIESEAEEAEREESWARLERRVDVAREADPNGAYAPLMVECFPDTFVIRRNSKAHARWRDKTIRASAMRASGQKGAGDPLAIDRDYAIECVHDWNGQSDFDANPDLTERLNKFLTENAAIVTPINDLAGKLAGVFAEERSKSD